MTTDTTKPAPDDPQQRFIESFDNFCVGLVNIKHVRATIAELLESEPHSAEIILAALDTAFREGLIKGSTYDSLAAEVDRATSEDEPTEWSEDTREHFDDTNASAADDTDYPAIASPHKSPHTSQGMTAREIAIGAVLKNRFELVSHIGTGSMANVYEAIDRRKQEAGSVDPRLAIKVISSAFSSHPNALKTIQREALTSQGLIHPNIIRVFDCDSDDDRFFMTMELLDGHSLVTLLDEHRLRSLPFAQSKSIIEALCNGLQYAHEQGIIHADIKPGNIFVSAAGQAKILDFGISRITSDVDETGDSPVAGAHTPAYASCEVQEGAKPTIQDDIFSMACVCYRMLSGHRAFGGLTALDAEGKNLKPKRIEMLNSQQWQILEQSLAFRRADRTIHITDFAAAFFNRSPAAKISNPPEDAPANTLGDGESRGLPLRFGIPAIAVMLIVIMLALFWPVPEPEPEPTPPPLARTDLFTPDALHEPSDTLELPATDSAEPIAKTDRPLAPESIEPTVSLTTPSDSPQKTLPVITAEVPVIPQPDPAQIRIDELETLADNAMNDGRLLDPADDSAHLYITELTELAPDNQSTQQRQTRLAELMLLEAMVAITDEDFDAAMLWISETKALGVPEEMTQRFDMELQKGRDALNARQTGTLGAIFASVTPAAIMAGPGIDLDDEQESAVTPEATTADPDTGTEPITGLGSLSLAMIMPGALPNVVADGTDKGPAGKVADTTDDYIPLSTLEFEQFVEPRISRRLSNRRTSGWVEVRFRVTTDGRTDDITVLAAQPDDRFNKTAVKAVSQWRFKPVYVDGAATEKYSGIRLHFKP